VAATSTTSVVALRIGNFQVERPAPDTTSARDRAAWLSARDAAHLIQPRRSGTAPPTTPGHDGRAGVGEGFANRTLLVILASTKAPMTTMSRWPAPRFSPRPS
jgi:hypothetical protein